uniref:uncharacterized protein LOC122592959 n=1 Tax=Erigeron canadensis TaxID=72917 RepID=UPI001CB8A4A4|nr:uncharacterized protein LOC122592959 [Erigeron canadensis]
MDSISYTNAVQENDYIRSTIQETEVEAKGMAVGKDSALIGEVNLLRNLYDFAKQNSGILKTRIVSAENTVVVAVTPVYEKLMDSLKRILVFVDNKFDKYTPTFFIVLVAEFESLIDKATPLAHKLLTTAQSIITPLVTAAVSLFQKVLKSTRYLFQKILATTIYLLQILLTTIKASPPVLNKSQALLQNGFTTAQSALQSAPLVNTAQSFLQNSLDTTKSVLHDSYFQKGPDLAKKTLDSTKSILGGIPLVGNVAQSAITNPKVLTNQIVNKTNALVNKSPVLRAVNSTAQSLIKITQVSGMKAALQSAYISFKLVGIPVIAEFWYKVNAYPLLHILSELFLPVAECFSKWYNKLLTYMDRKGYSLSGYLPSVPIDEMKAAYKVVKTTMDGLSAAGNLPGMNDT